MKPHKGVGTNEHNVCLTKGAWAALGEAARRNGMGTASRVVRDTVDSLLADLGVEGTPAQWEDWYRNRRQDPGACSCPQPSCSHRWDVEQRRWM